MKVLTVIGARPQFVKAAVLSRVMAQRSGISEVIVHTGQHYDANMSDIFFTEMNIPRPNYNLAVGGNSHGAMTGRMLEQVENVIIKEMPDAVLVYGDTNSTIAGALAAAKLHVPVAHVEAGLRSFNMKMPEEINRILTDRISHWLFCPTTVAVNNLVREGFIPEAVYPILANVGDVMYDAALYYKEIAQPNSAVSETISRFDSGFFLSTIHRVENTDDPERLKAIFESLQEISEALPIVVPLHPRTRKMLDSIGLYMISDDRLIILDPVSYFDMITLLSRCRGVFTDSGGVQKEAYFFQKPCITLREETEWVELVDYGFNTLVGANRERILAAVDNLRNTSPDYSMALYGHGDAGDKIVNLLLSGLH